MDYLKTKKDSFLLELNEKSVAVREITLYWDKFDYQDVGIEVEIKMLVDATAIKSTPSFNVFAFIRKQNKETGIVSSLGNSSLKEAVFSYNKLMKEHLKKE